LPFFLSHVSRGRYARVAAHVSSWILLTWHTGTVCGFMQGLSHAGAECVGGCPPSCNSFHSFRLPYPPVLQGCLLHSGWVALHVSVCHCTSFCHLRHCMHVMRVLVPLQVLTSARFHPTQPCCTPTTMNCIGVPVHACVRAFHRGRAAWLVPHERSPQLLSSLQDSRACCREHDKVWAAAFPG